jgi:hypothetical protein
MKAVPWYLRLLERLKLDPKSREARGAIAGSSKHERAKTKPRGWERKRKVRRKMATASRRRNLFRGHP